MWSEMLLSSSSHAFMLAGLMRSAQLCNYKIKFCRIHCWLIHLCVSLYTLKIQGWKKGASPFLDFSLFPPQNKNCSFFHTEAPHFILFDGGSIFFYYNSWLDNDPLYPPSNRCKLLGRSFVLIAPNQAQAKRQKCEGKMCFPSVFCTHTEEKKCTNHFKHNMAVRSAFSLPFFTL